MRNFTPKLKRKLTDNEPQTSNSANAEENKVN